MSETMLNAEQNPYSELKLPKVCLVIPDLKVAKDFAQVFKKMGTHPYIQSSLHECWTDLFRSIPDLVLMDVSLMGNGDQFISQHPLVLENKVPLAFYFDQQTRPLLSSTQSLCHLGLVQQAPYYDGQLVPILKRANQFAILRHQREELQNELLLQKNKMIEMGNQTQHLRQSCYYYDQMRIWIQQMDQELKKGHFPLALHRVLKSQQDIQAFSFMEISFNGQKLISADLSGEKFVSIPSLWLGEVCTQGLDFFAQNLVGQVAVEVLGEDVVLIFLSENFERANAVLMLQMKKGTWKEKVPWRYLETQLSALWAKSLHRDTKKEILNTDFQIIDAWPFQQKLDDLFHSIEVNQNYWQHMSVDLSPLYQTIAQYVGQRFYWARFFSDFCNQLGSIIIGESYICCTGPNGVEGVSILCKKESSMRKELGAFEIVKEFVKNFAYYRYFENPDNLLAQTIECKVQLLPLSPCTDRLKKFGQRISISEKTL